MPSACPRRNTGRNLSKVGLKEIGWMFAFALLNYAIAIPLGLISMNFIETAENPGISGMPESGVSEQVLHQVRLPIPVQWLT
jgi:hypothetical protein